jgi:adenylate kinase
VTHRVILLGPPGAGKGTQAARIAENLSVPKVASGDLFRDHQARDTELGRLARTYMERGDLVPDDVTIRMVMEWVEAHEGEGGFLLDGFPRTLAQAEALDREMVESGGIDRALYINVNTEELFRRLAGRWICRSCQTPYHEQSSPPSVSGKCDRCGGDLYQRDDDNAEAVQKRLGVFFKETEPLVQFYREAGILREVDGVGTVDGVEATLLEAVSH